MIYLVKNNLVIFTLLIVCVPLVFSDVNIETPTGLIFTGSLITISWSIYDKPPTQPASLTIQNSQTGEFTIIDDKLNLQTLIKTWDVSVTEGIYFLSIRDGNSEVHSGDFTVFTAQVIPKPTSDYKVTTIIAVISVGSAVILIIVLVGIWYIKWRHKKEREIYESDIPYSEKKNDDELVLSTDEKKYG
ncbi:743_t:CDS:2, partial [Dentiscutata erythropus]